MLIESAKIVIREMRFADEDFDLMERWLNDPAVLEFYEGRDHPFTRQGVIDKFGQRAQEPDDAVPCIAEYDGKPIGYVQYYQVSDEEKEEYRAAGETDAYGMDLFIGETRYWNQGIGTTIVEAMLEFLFKVKGADQVVIDPQTSNARAIRCYEKCRFRKVKLLPRHELHEGEWRDCWIMQRMNRHPTSMALSDEEGQGQAEGDRAAAGAAAYTRPALSIYDLWVLGFSCTFAWKCRSSIMLDWYNTHISSRHLDVGIGTGYFLDKCRFPSPNPAITLLDLNGNSLKVAGQRLARYQPVLHMGNVLRPLRMDSAGFDSIALNCLLHCLPGDLLGKAVVFQNLKPWMNDGGVLFGSTVLGQSVPKNFLARRLMQAYNSRGMFCNAGDNPVDLERILEENFREHSVRVVGCMALFSGRM